MVSMRTRTPWGAAASARPRRWWRRPACATPAWAIWGIGPRAEAPSVTGGLSDDVCKGVI